jgi:hypothetical protein
MDTIRKRDRGWVGFLEASKNGIQKLLLKASVAVGLLFLWIPAFAAPPPSTLASDFFFKLDSWGITYMLGGSSALAGAMIGPFKKMFLLSVIVFVILTILNLIDRALEKLAIRYFVAMAVAFFALNGGVYSSEIALPLYYAPDGFISAMSGGSVTSINQLIDLCITKGDIAATGYKDKATNFITGAPWYACWAICWFFTILIAAIVAMFLAGTKILLLLSLTVGPFFLCFLPFPMFRPWFEGWFKQTLSYIASFVLVTLAAGFMFSAWQSAIQTAVDDPGNGLSSLTPTVFIGLISIYVVFEALYMPRIWFGAWHVNVAGVSGRAWSAAKDYGGRATQSVVAVSGAAAVGAAGLVRRLAR